MDAHLLISQTSHARYEPSVCWDDVGEQEETVYLAFNYLFVTFCPAQPQSSCVTSCSCVPVLVLGFVKVLAVPLCTAESEGRGSLDRTEVKPRESRAS